MNIGDWNPLALAARVRSYWRGLRRRNAVEADMAEEFRHHLELRTADLMQGGLGGDEAARQARLEFGHIEGHRIDARAARGLASFDQLRLSALDVRLGVRMLLKYPGLSLVSVVGMALAIAIGAGVFSIISSLMETTLPLPGGNRVVAVRNALIQEPGRSRASLRDYTAWRDELKSVEDLAAFTTGRRNLVVPGTPVDLVRVVRMTASGFRIARTAPVLGRPLLDEDARSDAHVVVIGFDEWQRRFAADPGIIGRRIGLGSDVYTVVGVMPAEFRFPVDDRYWIPLVFGPAERARDDAVTLAIVGRLADGATLESAQVELTSIGTRMAAAYSETHARLRPQVLHYTRAFFDMDSAESIWAAHLFRFFISLLLIVVAVNVAILVYARTATRVGEITVRTALGASRARVVTQLFAEALVLSATAAVLGLTIAGIVLAKLQALAEREMGELPFWVNLGLSPGVITYALVLAIVGGAIVGVIPALKATGRRVQTNLQRLSGRSGRLQLGRAWTALIITQVAVAVAVLPHAVHFAQEAIGEGTVDPGFPVDEFLLASLSIERDDAVPGCDGRLCDDRASSDSSAANERVLVHRFRARAAELIRRLESDPAVAAIAVSGDDRSDSDRVELEDVASSGMIQGRIALGWVDINRVEPDFFAVFDMPILAGRAFVETDAHAGAGAVIVNHVFAETYLHNSAVLGRRIRFVRQLAESQEVEAGPWLEIVGVVRDFTAYEPQQEIYRPLALDQLSPPVSLAIRVRTSPAEFAPRLRAVAATVDPVLQLESVGSAAQLYREGQQFPRYLAYGTTAVMLSVLLLSAAGIYAMMSFTVARRRREIGIRSALGADPRRVLSSVFTRASAQLLAGIVFGVIGTIALDRLTGKGPVRDGNLIVLPLVALLMTVVGLLAAIGPARRGLAVQPTEALRDE